MASQLRMDILRHTLLIATAVPTTMVLVHLILEGLVEIDRVHVVHYVHIIDVLIPVINRIMIGRIIASAAVPDISSGIVGAMASDRRACGEQRPCGECG
jgi:hypothetical protein